MIDLPLNFVLNYKNLFKRGKLNQSHVDAIRLAIILIGAYFLVMFTNPSIIYHSLRGQNLFKLQMIKAVNEIIDALLKGYGNGVVENFSRSIIQYNTGKTRLNDVI